MKENGRVSSEVLRSELLEVWVEHIVANEGRTEAQAREGLDEYVGQLIEAFRKNEPEFLMVSPETENKLQRGEAIADSQERIVANTTPQSKEASLVRLMLEKRKAENRSPVREELLAHILVARKAAASAKSQD